VLDSNRIPRKTLQVEQIKAQIHHFTESEVVAMKEVFRSFDADNSGAISTDELYAVMKECGQEVSMEECVAIVKDVDYDNNGEIDFDEFMTLMTRKKKTDGRNNLQAIVEMKRKKLQEKKEKLKQYSTFQQNEQKSAAELENMSRRRSIQMAAETQGVPQLVIAQNKFFWRTDERIDVHIYEDATRFIVVPFHTKKEVELRHLYADRAVIEAEIAKKALSQPKVADADDQPKEGGNQDQDQRKGEVGEFLINRLQLLAPKQFEELNPGFSPKTYMAQATVRAAVPLGSVPDLAPTPPAGSAPRSSRQSFSTKKRVAVQKPDGSGPSEPASENAAQDGNPAVIFSTPWVQPLGCVLENQAMDDDLIFTFNWLAWKPSDPVVDPLRPEISLITPISRNSSQDADLGKFEKKQKELAGDVAATKAQVRAARIQQNVVDMFMSTYRRKLQEGDPKSAKAKFRRVFRKIGRNLEVDRVKAILETMPAPGPLPQKSA
jgi:hypothetical protein